MENKDRKKKITKIFLIGFVFMNIGGILLFIRDAQTDEFLYNFFSKSGYFLSIIGFLTCLVSMVTHWKKFFENIKK